MTLDNCIYYMQKLIFNSSIYKFLAASFVAFIWVMTPDHYIIFDMLLWLWILSMIFWAINWAIKHWFNLRKFLEWFAKIMTYWVLIYFAACLERVTWLWIWVYWFSWAMIFELLLSVMKHASELNIPMPKLLINFIRRQEKDFEDRFMWGNKKL